jgi:hypothetical protein
LYRRAIEFLRPRAIGHQAKAGDKREQRGESHYTHSNATIAAGTERTTPTRH